MAQPDYIDQDCVRLESIERECRECSVRKQTHVVMLDAPNNGVTMRVASPMCLECAQKFAGRLRDSLPAAH